MTLDMTSFRGLKKLVCFDVDGVLLDSRANMSVAWRAVRAELGIEVPFEAYFAQIGRPFAEIMGRLGLAARSHEIEAVFRRSSAAALHDTAFYPDAGRMLTTLRAAGCALAVVTSKDRDRTGIVLERLPVRFDTVQTPAAECRGKPAPDHLLMAMALCRTDPADTVFVGDMDADAEAARRAGIDYIHAAWGYGKRPSGCLATAGSCLHLLQILLPERSEEPRS